MHDLVKEISHNQQITAKLGEVINNSKTQKQTGTMECQTGTIEKGE